MHYSINSDSSYTNLLNLILILLETYPVFLLLIDHVTLCNSPARQVTSFLPPKRAETNLRVILPIAERENVWWWSAAPALLAIANDVSAAHPVESVADFLP